MRQPEPLGADQTLDIFRSKTSPAFQVALGIGAALAGATAETQQVLRDYSESLGIAYQIRDDLEDLTDPEPVGGFGLGGPSLLLALACDKTKAAGRERVMALWRGSGASAADRKAFLTLLGELAVEDRARALLEAYKEQAIRTLPALPDARPQGTAEACHRQRSSASKSKTVTVSLNSVLESPVGAKQLGGRATWSPPSSWRI
jgi:geranylgeranyl pyrophosphate synthase